MLVCLWKNNNLVLSPANKWLNFPINISPRGLAWQIYLINIGTHVYRFLLQSRLNRRATNLDNAFQGDVSPYLGNTSLCSVATSITRTCKFDLNIKRVPINWRVEWRNKDRNRILRGLIPSLSWFYKTFCRYGRDNCDIEIARQKGRYYVLKIYNVLKKSSLA